MRYRSIMFRRMAWVFVSVLTLLGCVVHATEQYVVTNDVSRPVLGVLENPAVNDEASAIWANPAGLAYRTGSTSFLSHSFRGPTDLRFTNVLIAGAGGGFGFQRTKLSDSRSVDRWSLAFAGGNRRLGISSGAAIRINDPDGYWGRDWFFSVDVGMLIRPASWLSIGGVARQLGAPDEYPPSVEGGIALRPMGNQYLTLMGSCAYSFEKGDIEDLFTWQVGAAVNIGPGLEISAGVNDDKTLMAGLTFDFGKGAIGGGGLATEDDRGPYFGVLRLNENLRQSAFAPGGGMAEIEIEGFVEDVGVRNFFGPSQRSVHSYITQINRAAHDPGVSGIYLRLDNTVIGRGLADELRAALVNYKERTGNPVVCYMAWADDNQYYIASVADSIYMEPVGHLGIDGYAMSATYLARAFEKFGIRADLVRAGRYKSATETFTDSTMSDAAREQYNAFLDDVYTQYVNAVARSRSMTPDSVRALIDRGPYTPRQALEVGLIDAIHGRQDALECAKLLMKERSGGSAEVTDMQDRRPYDDSWARRSSIAVLYASGTIMTGRSGQDFFSDSRYIGSETMVRTIRQIRENDDIKAVVLRIDSPGGSGLASDQIWQELNRLHATGKPVVVSMGNVAASGGYYIACRADTIIANPSSIVGSIGVFGGKISFDGLLDNLGIDTETVTRGENAMIFSVVNPLTEEQRRLLQTHIDEMYEIFVSHVAEGRDMTEAEVDSVGQGRIYSGERGVGTGLIDGTGGLQDALLIAMDMAGIEGRASIITYPKPRWFSGLDFDTNAMMILQPSSGTWFYDPVTGIR